MVIEVKCNQNVLKNPKKVLFDKKCSLKKARTELKRLLFKAKSCP